MPEPLESTSALGFSEWATQQGYYSRPGASYGFASDINNFFTGNRDKAQEAYQTYLDNLNRQYEVDKINNSRAWEEYMDSTKYQRMVADLQKVGINPALVLGAIGASGQPSDSSGSVSTKHNAKFAKSNKTSEASQWLSTAAMIVMTIAKIAAIAA